MQEIEDESLALSRDRALLLARACYQVYGAVPHLEGYACTPLYAQDSQTAIFESDDEIIVAFRGTDSRKEWRRNMLFRRKSIPGHEGKWHRGFTKGFFQVIPNLISYLSGSLKPVTFVGHSLGGAFAQLAAARLDKIVDVASVVTFGSPRVANKLAADTFNNNFSKRPVVHFKNLGDEIPHLPPLLLGYHETGRSVVLAPTKKHLTSVVAVSKLSNIVLDRVLKKGILTKLSHNIAAYIARINHYPHEWF